MKKLLYIYLILMIYLFAGCFDDKGNYDYKDLGISPTFLTDVIDFEGIEGEVLFIESEGNLFTFGQDSIEAIGKFRYEWEVNNVIVSEEKNLEIDVKDLMDKIGIHGNTTKVNSMFRIINIENDMRYLMSFNIKLSTSYGLGSFIILSEKGENSKLSYFRRKTKVENQQSILYFELEDDVFYDKHGYDIPGRPIKSLYSRALQISSNLGSTYILTDKVTYRINNESMRLHSEIEEEFLDGLPENSNFVNLISDNRLSFIANEKGQLFKREMSDNYLIGKFLSEPYYIDDKGYDVTYFAQSTFTSTSHLCLDKKNNRILCVQSTGNYGVNAKILPLLEGEGYQPLELWDLPKDIEVLHICRTYNSSKGRTYPYSIYYNQNGQTYHHLFDFDRTTMKVNEDQNESPRQLAVNLNADNIILTNMDYYRDMYCNVFYSEGNILYYYHLKNDINYPKLNFDSKITYLRFTLHSLYEYIIVGCENGDIFVYKLNSNTLDMDLISKANTGGKIYGIIETSISPTYDMYNSRSKIIE